jgi:hypothetical protein
LTIEIFIWLVLVCLAIALIYIGLFALGATSTPSLGERIKQKFTSVQIIAFPQYPNLGDYILVKIWGFKHKIISRNSSYTWKEIKECRTNFPIGYRQKEELLKEYERVFNKVKPPKVPRLKTEKKSLNVYKLERLIDGD